MDELHREDEPWLEETVEHLRRPVPIGADVEAKVAGAIARGEVHILPARSRRIGNEELEVRRFRIRRAVWLAAAVAAAAAFALALRIWPDRRAPAPAAATIEFALDAPTSRAVSVVGDFNNWDPLATPLERDASGRRWSVRIPLSPGRYRYVYLVDGAQWLPDPRVPRAPDNDYGAPASVVTVTGDQS